MAEHQNGNGPPANLSPVRGVHAYTIYLGRLSRRLKALYSHWSHHRSELWGSSNVLVVATPPPSDDIRYLKSSALNIWLLGYEFPETIMVFMNKQIHFLCSQKKASLLEVLKRSAKEAVGVDVVMHVKANSDDGTSQMDAIFHAVRAHLKPNDRDNPVIGYIAREVPEGNLLEMWAERLKNSSLQLSDITNGLTDLFAVKESGEIRNVKKAAYLTASAMKYFVMPKLERVIDKEKKISHWSLMDETEKAIMEPTRVKMKLKAENVDICYPPIFQSGGNFDLRVNTLSNDEYLYYDSASVIICAIGSRYKCYCSNVARTFLIDSTAAQSKAYEVLLKAHDAAIGALKPGNKVSAVYQAALSVVERDAPELVINLTKTAGAGIGLEFHESGLTLNANNFRVLKAGMVFNVTLSFQNLHTQTKNPKSQNFSLLLADTVIVTDKGHDVVTSLSTKAVTDIAYTFNEDEKEELPKVKAKAKGRMEALYSKATLRSDNQEISKEELRRQHQAELARQNNEETAQRLAGGGSAVGDNRTAVFASNLIAYKNINDLPPPREMMIHVDQKNEAILLPIHGSMVPFHVATVKTVSCQQDTSRNCYIRITFNDPVTHFNPHNPNNLQYQQSIYLKAVSFCSKDLRHISEAVQLIRTLKRNVAREPESAERATFVTPEKLIVAGNKFKPIRLPDLRIRPSFGGCVSKLTGTLEAHTTRLQYSTSRQDLRVDVMYENIKHAFFQPAEKEMIITLLHFHLHNRIMVGNKKTRNVQFYVEMMDLFPTLEGGKKLAHDLDEIEEEKEMEMDGKNKINMDFQNFVKRVNDLWGRPQFKGLELAFDRPLRKLGFLGVLKLGFREFPYNKASAFIVPTSSCLVELIEIPFLVISLSEIEIVSLKRVGLGQKNLKLTIGFKDVNRDMLLIDSIPSTSLDGIKEWLDSMSLKYCEIWSWRPILRTISDEDQDSEERRMKIKTFGKSRASPSSSVLKRPKFLEFL